MARRAPFSFSSFLLRRTKERGTFKKLKPEFYVYADVGTVCGESDEERGVTLKFLLMSHFIPGER